LKSFNKEWHAGLIFERAISFANSMRVILRRRSRLKKSWQPREEGELGELGKIKKP